MNLDSKIITSDLQEIMQLRLSWFLRKGNGFIFIVLCLTFSATWFIRTPITISATPLSTIKNSDTQTISIKLQTSKRVSHIWDKGTTVTINFTDSENISHNSTGKIESVIINTSQVEIVCLMITENPFNDKLVSKILESDRNFTKVDIKGGTQRLFHRLFFSQNIYK